ncbi:hypothetical protein MMC22_004850 [Lobaria immixta]|nr:hypothetical protein [Lobaria immixta]
MGPPPPGGDQNKGPALLAVSLTTGIIAFIATALRLVSRVFIVRQVGWDDFTISIAEVSKSTSYPDLELSLQNSPQAISIFAVAVDIEQVKHGAGRHTYYLSSSEITKELEWHAFSQIQLFICTAFAKVSVCLFLIRIVNKKPLVRFLYALIAALVVMNGAVTIMLVTQCRPLRKVWEPKAKGECWGIHVVKGFGYAAGDSQTTIQISAILEENVAITAVNLPAMRALYGAANTRVYRVYTQFRSGLRKRLRSSNNIVTAERLGSNPPEPLWDLPLPGKTIMKTIDLDVNMQPVENVHENEETQTRRSDNTSSEQERHDMRDLV